MSEDVRAVNPYDDAIEEVHYRWTQLINSKTLGAQASAIVEIQDAVSNLITWHSGYDLDSGTMPWERGDDE